ncbi:MAG: PilZ domain-containing protein [Gammaproteobacteria bacterium]|nr:PilZ domain-containing protein [Gammaproteobacteria bacterium]MDH3466628.1 PilZ domain-containing protein [Gammaproteobacteria bacterium]
MSKASNKDARNGANGANGAQAADGQIRPSVLSLTIKDKSALYSSYMPFLQNGGLFIPSNKHYKLGEEVFMLLTLLEEHEKIPIAGTVVWVTPVGAQGNRAAGVGVQFSDKDSGAARNKIEAMLGAALQSDRPTHTM